MSGLSPAEQKHYHEQGYVIPSYRLPPEQLAELREAVDWVIENNPQARPEHLVSVHVVNNQPERIKGHPSFLDLVGDSVILDLVESAIGRDILLWGAHLFCKPVKTGMEVPMHQDGEYWPIRPLATCSVWIAMDEATPENGCLRVIPGSHRDKRLLGHDTNNSDDLTLNQQLKPEEYAEEDAADIVLQPGQISLHDIYMVHGSKPNRSDKRRAGYVLRFMPTTSHFDRNLGAEITRKTGGQVDFVTRSLILMRGEDACGKNDITRVMT